MLIVSSLVLAGCAGISEDEAKEIAEELIDVPGCNDEAAYNYDENATNANACYTEAILQNTVADFILFLDQGPAWGETGGLMTEGSEVDEDGERATFKTTMAMSPDGIYVMTEMNMGMMPISMGELVTENSENGKTNIQSTWMGSTFMMHSDATFAEHWNEVSFNENNTDSEDDSDSEDDMEMGDDDMGMEMPDTEVDIPDDFDPATALYEAGLATDNGYSFSTTLDHGEGYSTTMTFSLSSMFEVTKVVLEETDPDGMVSTSSITVLTAAEVDALLVDDENLVQHALPFILSPIEPMMDMVCYDINSHQLMMQIDNQDDCENSGYMWVPANSGPGGDGDGGGDGHDHGGDGDGGDGDGHDDGHDHGGDGDGHDDGHDHGGDGDDGEMMLPLDWSIESAEMMTDVSSIEGAFDDYSIVLALCTMDEDSMDGDDMMGAPSMTCGEDVLKISIADAMMEGASVGFHDADNTGTITTGDMIHVSPDYEADQPWNTVRLHSTSADKYSDENPMLPGFGVIAGLVALISAAMIARRD